MRLPNRIWTFGFAWISLALLVSGYWDSEVAELAKRPSFKEALKGVLTEYKGESKFDLNEFVGFKSISGSGKHVKDLSEAADWLVGRLGHMLMQNARVYETDGVHPIVYADWLLAGAHKPTILIYGFYDVPPLNPLLSWDEPFKLSGQGNTFWARGVAGGKGALLMAIQAVERILRTNEVASDSRTPSLPFNVKFVFESQAEMGSPDFKAFLQKHRDLLAADLCLAAAGGPPDTGSPPSPVPDTLANQAAAKAWKNVLGGAIHFNRDTRSVPALAAIQSELGLTPTVFGWDLGADRNTPKESLKPEKYDKGMEAWVNLLLQLCTEEVAKEVRASKAAAGAAEPAGKAGAGAGDAEPGLDDEGLCSWGGPGSGDAQGPGSSCSSSHDEL